VPREPLGELILTRRSRDGRYGELCERHLLSLISSARGRAFTPEEGVEWDRLIGELGRVSPPELRRSIIERRIGVLDDSAQGRVFTGAEQAEWDRLKVQLEQIVRPGQL
jgi:hypothetical protein